MVFWSSGSGALSSSSWSQSEDKECRRKSGSGNGTTVAFLTGRPAPPTQEDKVESFCVCCACERCMDFWLSTSLKCFSTWKSRNNNHQPSAIHHQAPRTRAKTLRPMTSRVRWNRGEESTPTRLWLGVVDPTLPLPAGVLKGIVHRRRPRGSRKSDQRWDKARMLAFYVKVRSGGRPLANKRRLKTTRTCSRSGFYSERRL